MSLRKVLWEMILLWCEEAFILLKDLKVCGASGETIRAGRAITGAERQSVGKCGLRTAADKDQERGNTGLRILWAEKAPGWS